jgi:hypothetical protein
MRGAPRQESGHALSLGLPTLNSISQPPEDLCRYFDDEVDVALRLYRAPGTTGMHQLFFTKEIYFAMSEIRPFSVLVRV